MKVSDVYPRKGKTKMDVGIATQRLTGYDAEGLQSQLQRFFAEAPQINPNAVKVTGGHLRASRYPLMQNIRRLDKLVDEVAKGRAMEKILRQ
jgi:hypothetical protein